MKVLHPPISGPRRGVTLTELAIATLIMAILMGLLGVAVDSTTDAFETGSTRSDLQSRARRAMDRIVREVTVASSASLGATAETPFWTDTLAFDAIGDVDPATAAITWAPTRIFLELDPAETDDDTDEDGDGLIDERRVVLVRDAGLATEQRVVLVQDVAELLEGEVADGNDDNQNGLADETGLVFARSGNRITVRLTLEAVDPHGHPAVYTIESQARVRN